jgi:hypothetical protein
MCLHGSTGPSLYIPSVTGKSISSRFSTRKISFYALAQPVNFSSCDIKEPVEHVLFRDMTRDMTPFNSLHVSKIGKGEPKFTIISKIGEGTVGRAGFASEFEKKPFSRFWRTSSIASAKRVHKAVQARNY